MEHTASTRAGDSPSLYGFDLFSTPEQEARLNELAMQWLKEAADARAESLVTGHGV